EAVIEMLDFANVDLKGKRVTVVGRSLVIGKPVSMLLMKKNATVTVCHTKTVDMPGTCKQAEVLVAAAGVAKMIDQSYVADGAIVVDVGINVDAEGNLCGDVNFDDVADTASMMTPVPGGVGSVTTSVLAKHLLKAAKAR
ncbi:MAG: bifunctional 5,10-methylene-tetrahydrofolate dehydrogenase/5,10-methylene-tetrahydrofolate cyclohydrolase, partial [Lachnospira sp.]|nr:bifunctional 5,10-methylene-tetrahydrofolate dehydrogenase/5,10-methylene-tetrahydrofolate cyclohydrolase [Lachnospira sp.]